MPPRGFVLRHRTCQGKYLPRKGAPRVNYRGRWPAGALDMAEVGFFRKGGRGMVWGADQGQWRWVQLTQVVVMTFMTISTIRGLDRLVNMLAAAGMHVEIRVARQAWR